MAEKTMVEVLRAECPGAADALGVFFAALIDAGVVGRPA